MTLTEFVLARIAEDEHDADWQPRDSWDAETVARWAGQSVTNLAVRHAARWSPNRVLAECEAKRRIVERAGAFREPSDESAIWDRWDQGWAAAMEGALKILALPYADRPDYDESWRP